MSITHERPPVDLVHELGEGSGISVLSSSGAETTNTTTGDILEETEKLLARMNNLTKIKVISATETDNQAQMIFNGANADETPKAAGAGATTTETPPILSAPAGSTMLNVSAETEDSNELNEMLEKAGQLSSIMQSISERGSERPTSSRSQGGSFEFGGVLSITEGQEQLLPASINYSDNHTNVHGRRDPDGNSITGAHEVIQSPLASPPAVAHVTPTTVGDDNSSFAAPKRGSTRQDPPGSVAEEHQEGISSNIKIPLEKASPSPEGSLLLQRPTSAVHLPVMYDDEVSSVGSASFRPYPRQDSRSSRDQPSRQFSPAFTHTEEEYVESSPNKDHHATDILLGVRPSSLLPPPNLDLTQNTESPLDSSPELFPEPVCSKIPPIDVITESSSPRDAKAGAVQWEKVTTALPGEDDYVPLVDYSHVRPSPSKGKTFNQESRLEKHRKLNQARRKRRMRLLAVALPVVVLAVVGGFFLYKKQTPKPPVLEVVEEEEVDDVVVMPVLLKTFDTARMQNPAADGYSFESEDPFLVVTFPRFIPAPEEPEEEVKPKRRGFFGRMRKQ